MEITEVKVFPIQEEKLKAFVSVVFDQCFMVNDIKIIQGRDGFFISMPSRKKKNGEFKDVAHPLNNETRRMIEEKVLGEYERVLSERGEQLPAPLHAAHPVAAAAAVDPALIATPLPAAGAFPINGDGGDGGAAGAKGPGPGAVGAVGAAQILSFEPAATHPAPPASTAIPVAPGPPGDSGAGADAAQAQAQEASSPEKSLDEIEELHLRDSFWTVT
jgi:stage V sporulation protein G